MRVLAHGELIEVYINDMTKVKLILMAEVTIQGQVMCECIKLRQGVVMLRFTASRFLQISRITDLSRINLAPI